MHNSYLPLPPYVSSTRHTPSAESFQKRSCRQEYLGSFARNAVELPRSPDVLAESQQARRLPHSAPSLSVLSDGPSLIHEASIDDTTSCLVSPGDPGCYVRQTRAAVCKLSWPNGCVVYCPILCLVCFGPLLLCSFPTDARNHVHGRACLDRHSGTMRNDTMTSRRWCPHECLISDF